LHPSSQNDYYGGKYLLSNCHYSYSQDRSRSCQNADQLLRWGRGCISDAQKTTTGHSGYRTRSGRCDHPRRLGVNSGKELYFIEQHQIQTFFYLEKDYPSRLKHYPDAPLLLYFKGNASLNHLRTVGVIGTREPSFYGKALCEELVEALAPYQAQIISGLAFGVDITAHRAALQSGQETIGVLGNGLQQIYPFHHREIAMRMIDQGGLLTELPSFKGPDREHFPMRNRIVAALSDAVIVVETATKGGSMITARLANDYNKDVFAFPGRVGDPKSEGCNLLIKSHRAHLIEQVEDLVYTLRWEPQTPQQTELFVELDEAEKQVVQLVRAKPEISVDELAYEMAHPISQLAPLLLSLEFKGMVRALPGNRYVAM
jgi:DNA processing protein